MSMLFVSCLDPVDAAPLAGGLQISAAVSTQSPHPGTRIAPQALRSAAVQFLQGRSAFLGEMFSKSAGVIDDITVSDDGSVYITATVSEASSAKKVCGNVLKALALAVKTQGRDPSDPTFINDVAITGVSLVDAPDGFGDALVTKASAEPHVIALRRIASLSRELLELSARIQAVEAPLRRQ